MAQRQVRRGEWTHHAEDLLGTAEVGDILAFDMGTYLHYGVVEDVDGYNGDIRCINMTAENGGTMRLETVKDLLSQTGGSSGGSFNKSAGSVGFKGGRVRIDNKDEEKMEHGVSNPDRWAMISRIRRYARDGVRMPYNVFVSNCEHWATYIRYGIGWSSQVWRSSSAVADVCETVNDFSQRSTWARAAAGACTAARVVVSLCINGVTSVFQAMRNLYCKLRKPAETLGEMEELKAETGVWAIIKESTKQFFKNIFVEPVKKIWGWFKGLFS